MPNKHGDVAEALAFAAEEKEFPIILCFQHAMKKHQVKVVGP